MVYTVDGLVIKSQNYGENDRLITILTADGKITTVAKGARSMKSKLLNLTQPFVYGNFEINQKGNASWIRNGSSYELFYGLRDEVEKLFLATYVCDVAHELSGENIDSSEILRLTLNTLYAIMKDLRPLPQIKAVFELRSAGISGYMPSLNACERCGKESSEDSYFDVMNGALICSECLNGAGDIQRKNPSLAYDDIRESRVLIPLTPASLSAVRFALCAPQEKIFSFTLTREDDLSNFARAGEGYLLNHLGHGFDSLELYYSII